MIEETLSNKRTIEPTSANAEVEKIKKWFKTEYIERLNRIDRYKYLGLPMLESRYALEMEAYEKENKMRELLGEELLPEPKFQKII